MKTTLEAILITLLLMLPGFVEAQQQQVIIQPNNNLYNVDTTDPHVGWINRNIARGAMINDELTIRHLSPPVKVEVLKVNPQPIEQPSKSILDRDYQDRFDNPNAWYNK